MDKLILNNGTTLEIIDSMGLQKIEIADKTMDELESLLTTENLSNVQFATSEDLVYGIFQNLKFISITKYISDGSISIQLAETITQ